MKTKMNKGQETYDQRQKLSIGDKKSMKRYMKSSIFDIKYTTNLLI